MYNRIVFGLIFFIGMTVNAQATVDTVNIRGTITSEGKGIAGAVVTLLGQNMMDTTDENGTFFITKNMMSVFVPEVHGIQTITLKKGILELSLSKVSLIKIEIFDMKGHLLKRRSPQTPLLVSIV